MLFEKIFITFVSSICKTKIMKRNPISCVFFIENENHLKYLNSLLSGFNSMDIIGSLRNSLEAIAFLNDHKPTVLFMETRFAEILHSIKKPPFIVGISEKTNVKGIRNLLSFGFFDIFFTPLNERQIFNVMGKIWNIWSNYPESNRKPIPMVAETSYLEEYNHTKPGYNKDFLFLKKNDVSTRINLNDIAFLSRCKNQICFHLDNGTEKLIRKSLKFYQEKLPCEHFLKINKEIIVNIDKVTKFVKPDKLVIGNYLFNVSRSFKKAVKEKILL